MQTFYWVVADALAGCSCPGGRPRYRDAGALTNGADALDEDLAWLRAQGVDALLTLTESPLPADALARHGLTALHLPVPDLTAPLPAQLDQALGFIDMQRAQGRRVAVHCLMGQGRTGTVLAAYLIRAGATPAEALSEIRALCPGAVENPEQERALRAFATQRQWIV
jgi:atypical dual specificity phosphatase